LAIKSTKTSKQALSKLPIERDSTFSRAVADRVYVVDLGRDFELSCLQIGPALLAVEPEDLRPDQDKIAVDLRPMLTEVCRLRLSHPTAVALAMQILSTGISGGYVNREAIVASLQSEEIAGTEENGEVDDFE
jgi:hypothetical protein